MRVREWFKGQDRRKRPLCLPQTRLCWVWRPPDGSEGEVAKAADGLGWYAADAA
jgi:hypothetical protein